MSFNWRDEEINQVYLNAEICEKIYQFVEDGLRVHDSVIIHGIGTQTTSFLVSLVYLMRKFKWTFMKSFDYLVMKRPTLVIS